jgi:cob(I)alamin adenosyltransferase
MSANRDLLLKTYHELIVYANKIIIESPEASDASITTKKLASHMLREIIFRIYSKLFRIHNHLLTTEEAEIFEQTIRALFSNIHTRFDTKPFSDVLEQPWSL